TAALVPLVADLLAWDLDLRADAQPGDRFRVLVEKQLAGERFDRYGRVLAVEYATKTGSLRAYRFLPEDGGDDAFYDERGEALAQGLETGQAVRQRQVLGYPGPAGPDGAAHLRYAVKMGGHFVDPLRLRPAREPSLTGPRRDAFLAALAPRRHALAAVETRPP